MSHLSDFIARERLNLQRQSHNLNELKFATEQQNFNRKIQADMLSEIGKNETNLRIAQLSAQSQLDSQAIESLLNGLNQTQAFFQAEFAKKTAHAMELQKISHETRAKSILERLKNRAEINQAKLNAKLEIRRMVQENELKKDYLFFEKYCEIFFGLLARDLGLNAMEANAENIEKYVAEAFAEMGLDGE